MPLALSDAEIDAVMSAAKPIPPERRDEFLRVVADALAQAGEIGPGSLHRLLIGMQRAFFDPPNLDGAEEDSARTALLCRANFCDPVTPTETALPG
jgi:hypothetical protein